MAIRIKPIEKLADKYATRGSAAGADYAEGIAYPKRDQAEAAAAAEPAYEAGVTEAIGRKAFGAGVRAAGSAKWARKSLDVGKARFPGGVTAAKADWAKGAAPILSAISAVELAPRGPKGSEQNVTRFRQVIEAARKAKLGG
jgi:hypothetical protein